MHIKFRVLGVACYVVFITSYGTSPAVFRWSYESKLRDVRVVDMVFLLWPALIQQPMDFALAWYASSIWNDHRKSFFCEIPEFPILEKISITTFPEMLNNQYKQSLGKVKLIKLSQS